VAAHRFVADVAEAVLGVDGAVEHDRGRLVRRGGVAGRRGNRSRRHRSVFV